VLHAAHCKYRTQKSRQKSPSRHHRTTLWGHIFATKACIDNLVLLLLFFPRLISAAADWMSAILPHMVWPYSANLRCRSETCCTRLAENTGRKKVAKNRHLGTIAQLCQAISSQLRHVSTIGKKLVTQQYILHMSPQHGELRLTSG